jgi:GNAT superfamily N-acetyltransferase
VSETDDLLVAFDQQARPEPASPPAGTRYEHDGPVLRVVGRHQGFISAPRDTGLRGEALDQLIARQRDYFAARGQSAEWKTWGYDEPPDLGTRLRGAGFVPEPTETVLIGPTEQMASEPVLPEGVVLRQVTSEADMRRIGAMQSAVWGEDWSPQAAELAAAVAATPDLVLVWTAEADGEVVSSGRLDIRPGSDFAGLWGGSTLPQWRGRGIYRALVARRAQAAAARGVRYLQVDATDASAPILRRLGFRPVTTTTPYVWTPPISA